MPTLTIQGGLPVNVQIAPDGTLTIWVDLADALDLRGSESVFVGDTEIDVDDFTDNPEWVAHVRTALDRVRNAIEVKV